VQKELAERIARDKKESLLSLSVKAFGTPSYVKTVKRGHFTPPPKVDSAIIKVTNINHDFFGAFNQDLFFQVIKAGFSSKRKQLAPNLKHLFPVFATKTALKEIGLPTTIRAEDVSLEQWYQLIMQLQSTI
jgi:16S rRNA (adenine1518-N6/adenine1519-N6)-dimethyltransferase